MDNVISSRCCHWCTAVLDTFSEAVEVAIHYALARCGPHRLSTEPRSLNFPASHGRLANFCKTSPTPEKAAPADHALTKRFDPGGFAVLPCFRCPSAAVTLDRGALEHKVRAKNPLLQVRHILEDQIRVSVDNDK